MNSASVDVKGRKLIEIKYKKFFKSVELRFYASSGSEKVKFENVNTNSESRDRFRGYIDPSQEGNW